MNQILSMGGGADTPNGGMSNPFENNRGSQGSTLDTKKAVLVFAVVLIIFGVALSAVGIVNLMSSINGKNTSDGRWPVFTPDQVDNNLSLTISNDKVIEQVVYNWNDGVDTVVEGDGKKHMFLKIEVPVGDNILNLVVIDENGKESTYRSRFTGVAIEDLPEIHMSRKDPKINIVASSTTNTPLKYVSYKWNNGEEVIVEPSADPFIIETQVSIMMGENTLTVVAEKENGVRKEMSKIFKGLVKPTITLQQNAEMSANVIIEHDSGIQSAVITLDDKNINLTQDWFGEDKKSISVRVYLKENMPNKINVKVTSYDGAEAEKTFDTSVQ